MKYIALSLSLLIYSSSVPFAVADTSSDVGFTDAKELVALAIENNFGLEVSRLEVGIKDDNVEAEWGRFAPILGVEIGVDQVYRRQNAEDQRNNIFSTATETFEGERDYFTTSISGRLPFGTTYELSAGTTRNDNTYTAQSNTPFDPEFGSEVSLTVTQPLLKNFGLDVGLAPVNIAKSEREAAKHETKGAIEAVMARVLLACYEVHFASENVAVKEESVQLANTLLDANQKRVDQGRMSNIDVTQAEARVAEAEAERVQARSFFKERQSRLRELTQTSYDFDGVIYHFDAIENLLPLPATIDEAASYATEMLSHNPDYMAALQKAETEGVRVAFTHNQRYPELNLILSLSTSGLDNDFGSSYGDFENRKGPSWGVGLAFSMPLDNRTANAQHRASKRREAQALLRAKETEIQLLSALDVAIDTLDAGIERRRLISESVRLAEEALKAEEVRLANGVTTNNEVLNQQRELSVSRTQALASEVEIYKAYLQLLLLQGTLSEQLGFQLEFAANVE
jgi:outer membrane protein TolC